MAKYVGAGLSRTPRAYVLLAHAGHGINSYALHYYLVQRPLILFLQVGWGGAYAHEAKDAAAVNECFRLCHELVAAVDAAVKKGALRLEAKVPVVAADFYPRYNVYPPESLHMKRWPRPLESDSETADLTPQLVLSEAAKWFRSLVPGSTSRRRD